MSASSLLHRVGTGAYRSAGLVITRRRPRLDRRSVGAGQAVPDFC